MQFTTYSFIFAFLPMALMGYFTINRYSSRWASAFLAGMSLFFYGYANPWYLLFFGLSILLNYGLARQIIRRPRKKGWLALGLVYNIGALLVLKYYNFFVESLNLALKTDFNLIHLFLPLGISFYTFQFIALLMDCYRGKITSVSFETYLVFSTFFPKIIQGPIMFYQDFAAQYGQDANHRFQVDNFAKGLYALTFGLAKKVLVADVLGKFVNYGFGGAYASFDSLTAILLILSYTFQIYFDFSGYSDMARGIGLMFNLRLPVNFNSPYQALSVNDFWKRWHMSLTNFFTRYLYIPLGGNRKGENRTLLNVFLVFVISGLWHGANYTFLVWGILHGLASVIERKYIHLEKINVVLRWLMTFAFVNMAWVFFRADSVLQAIHVLRAALRCDFSGVQLDALWYLRIPEVELLLQMLHADKLIAFFPYLFLFVLLVCLLQCRNTDEKLENFRPKFRTCLVTIFLLSWSILSFGSTVSFIYERF